MGKLLWLPEPELEQLFHPQRDQLTWATVDTLWPELKTNRKLQTLLTGANTGWL